MPLVAAAILAASAATPLTTVRDAYPSLSPDGSTLLFQSNRAGRNAIYLADADGANVRVIYDAEEAETPAWSPDGAKIAFVAVLGGTPALESRMNAAGYANRAEGLLFPARSTFQQAADIFILVGDKLFLQQGACA